MIEAPQELVLPLHQNPATDAHLNEALRAGKVRPLACS